MKLAFNIPPSWRGVLSRPVPYAAGLIILVIALDQISKALILRSEVLHGLDCLKGYTLCGRIELSQIFDLTMVWNRGVSFGLFSADGAMRWVLFAMSLLVAGGFSIWLWQVTSWRTAVPLALIIGGAIGNMIDRVRFGAVVDFLDFSGLYFPFVFNVADACITIGAGLLLLDQFLIDTKNR